MALQLSWSKQSVNEIAHGFDPYRSQLTPFCPINPCQLTALGHGWNGVRECEWLTTNHPHYWATS